MHFSTIELEMALALANFQGTTRGCSWYEYAAALGSAH